MKKLLLTIVAVSALVTFKTSAAVDPCWVNSELCPERPPRTDPKPKPCRESRVIKPREARVSLQVVNKLSTNLKGMDLPSSVSLHGFTALLEALRSDLPSFRLVKSISLIEPATHFKVIDSGDCEYIYKIEVSSTSPLGGGEVYTCLLYTSPSPRDATLSRMPSSA